MSVALKKTAADGSTKKLVESLLAANKSPDLPAKLMLDICVSNMGDPAKLHAVFKELFQQLKDVQPSAEAQKTKAKYEQALQELKQGPPRPATFVCKADGNMPGPKPRVEVVSPDGHRRYPSLVEGVKLEDLTLGGTVFLDPEGAVVLGASTGIPHTGPEAKFLRRLAGTEFVELQLRDERFVVHAAQPLLDALDEDQVQRDDRVIFCPRREIAFRAVPADRDHRHRFVDQAHIPDVLVNRDIGKPHWSLAWLLRRTEILLTRPDVMEAWDLRPRASLLMLGPPGTGKTLTIRAYLREFSEMLVERTGRNDIGSRVIRVKTSDLLSPWFGETDQNIDELFNNVMEIGQQVIETAKGERIRVPVVLILEECEALARRRGEQDGSGVYDRVIGTLLQRMDDPTDDLASLPMITIATSNSPALIDAAAWRRLAGMVARFERLDREGLHAVLSKKIKSKLPFAARNGQSPEQLRSKLLDEVVSAVHSPNGDDDLFEVTLRDGTKLKKGTRHMLTGAIVEQTLAEAIDRAAFAAASGVENVGLSSGLILEALYRQVDNLADNLTVQNVAEHVDLPENSRVADVQRLRPARNHTASVITEEE